MEMLIAWATSQVAVYVGGSIAAFIILWILKRIPNEKIKEKIGKFFFGFGRVITLGLSKWKWSAPYWNKIIEPWFIDFVDNVFGEALKEFIRGLRSDNK